MSPGTSSAVFMPLLQNLKIGVLLSGAFRAEGSWTGELCRCVSSRCAQHSRAHSLRSAHISPACPPALAPSSVLGIGNVVGNVTLAFYKGEDSAISE